MLRRVGVRLRLRRDLRGGRAGQGRAPLGAWTLGLIAVLQVTNIVVTRLATSAVAQDPEGAGFSVYTNAFLVVMVPHSIITVSVATAVLPDLSELASPDRRWEANATVVRALRLALAPASVPVRRAAGSARPDGHGGALRLRRSRRQPGPARGGAVAVHPGLIGLTIHYVLQRGFYPYEDTRTPVFIQLAIAAVQILLAWAVVPTVETTFVAGALAAAWSVAYLAGAGVSVAVVSRRIGRLPVGSLLWLLARSLLAAGLSALVAWQVSVFVLVLLGSTTLQEAGGVDADGVVDHRRHGQRRGVRRRGDAAADRGDPPVGRRGAPPSRRVQRQRRGLNQKPLTIEPRVEPRLEARRGVTTSVRVEPGHLVVDQYQVGVQVDDNWGVRGWRARDELLARDVLLTTCHPNDPPSPRAGGSGPRRGPGGRPPPHARAGRPSGRRLLLHRAE